MHEKNVSKMISARASFLFKLKRSTLHFHLLPLSFVKPKTQPLKFNKCSSFPEERERTDERANSPTSYLHYVRDATDSQRGARGQQMVERREVGESRRRSGDSETQLRVASGFLGRARDSGFSRDRVSGVSVCADRLRSRRVRCLDSLCHSWHTKNKSGDRLVFTVCTVFAR